MDHLDTLPFWHQSLGRRIPKDIRANLGPVELKVRCEAAAELLDKGKTYDATLVLEACSLKAFMESSAALSRAIDRARKQDVDPSPAFDAMGKLVKRNPQPVFDRVNQGDMKAVEAILIEISSTPTRQRRRWQFWKRGK